MQTEPNAQTLEDGEELPRWVLAPRIIALGAHQVAHRLRWQERLASPECCLATIHTPSFKI
jgi:hypothetical protein